MPRAYFDPESLSALAEVFAEAKRRLNTKDINDPMTLDAVASRILALASEGLPPMIIREMVDQDSAEGGRDGGTSTVQQNPSHTDGGADAP